MTNEIELEKLGSRGELAIRIEVSAFILTVTVCTHSLVY